MYKEIGPSEFNLCPFDKIGKDWMLITAGNETGHNTMTAAWGGFGVLFGKNVSFIFVRPQRYTKKFIDSEDGYSLCFFANEYRETLNICGKYSGREINKDEKCDITVDFCEGIPYYKEADTVVICKKVYRQSLDGSCFIDKEIENKSYPQKDYHDLYVGEIIKILIKE